MAKFTFTWSEKREAVIEADSLSEAHAMYCAGDYDSEWLYDHDFECEAEEDSPTS